MCIRDSLGSLLEATNFLKQQQATSDPIRIVISCSSSLDTHRTKPGYEKFIEALLSASTTGIKITNVHLAGPFWRYMDEDVVHRLCDALAALPHLTDLVCQWKFPIKYVTRIMSRAKAIRRLEVRHFTFQSTPEEVSDFSRALRTHSSLSDLNLGGIFPTSALNALASIPNLGALDLWNFDHPPEGLSSQSATCAALGELIFYPKLQSLKLPSGPFPISSVSTRLCQSRSIQDLSLSVFSPEDMQHLANIVKENQMLKVLRIFIRHDQHATLLVFINALKGNSTLSDVFIQPLFHIGATKSFSREVQYGLVSMLETSNFTLRKLKIAKPLLDCERTNASLQHLIKLNSLGWKNLVQDRRATRNDWVAKLVAAERDPSIIYSLLSKNPSALVDSRGNCSCTASPTSLGAGQCALSDDKARRLSV